MIQLPRIALGTVQADAETRPMAWALSEAFRRIDVGVQSFLSRAHFSAGGMATGINGRSPRHLDSWLMSADACRALFVYGARSADLAVVEGRFSSSSEEDGGGQLEPLCQWLDLPRVVVLDVTHLEDCRLPNIPPHTAGILLDGFAGARQFARLATNLESIFRVPVLGGLERMPLLRGAIARASQEQRIPAGLCRQLGDRLVRWWKPDRIRQIAARSEMPAPDPAFLRGARGRRCRLTVAIAYDEAFNRYFPNTLDLLELRGASVVGFSPLRDEQLPPQTDVVVFGCGHPERYADTLSENHCMIASLRSHLCAGRRVYAEGGGAAYLCRQMETPWGEFKSMTGVLPATARLADQPVRPDPIEVRLARPTWLGPKGTRLRGYRNSTWQLKPLDGYCRTLSADACRCELIGSFQTIGSLIHLDLAADPYCLDHLFHPEHSGSTQVDPFAVVEPRR